MVILEESEWELRKRHQAHHVERRIEAQQEDRHGGGKQSRVWVRVGLEVARGVWRAHCVDSPQAHHHHPWPPRYDCLREGEAARAFAVQVWWAQ